MGTKKLSLLCLEYYKNKPKPNAQMFRLSGSTLPSRIHTVQLVLRSMIEEILPVSTEIWQDKKKNLAKI